MELPNSKSVLEVAVLLKTTERRVLQLIDSGELKARNIGRGAKRPRWRILDEAIEEFRRGCQGGEVVGVVRQFV